MKRIASILLAAACALPAFANEGAQAVAQACKADVEKLCPGVQPGEGRIAACLKEHKTEVSKPCKMELVKQRKEHKGAKAG
jgi:hypothetical protein